jgi:hypothetical protein
MHGSSPGATLLSTERFMVKSISHANGGAPTLPVLVYRVCVVPTIARHDGSDGELTATEITVTVRYFDEK